jgi:hypothetical protein
MVEIPYTIRLAPALIERIERAAHERGTAARKLVRAVLIERFGGDGEGGSRAKDDSSRQQALAQLRFDLTRTRLTLQHLLDHQIGSEATDKIRQTAQAEAERYIERLNGKGWA